MLKGLMGKKLGMMRLFGPGGVAWPVTVIELGPNYVIQKKTSDKDGYEALQVAFEALPERKVNKPLQGHFQAAGKGAFRHLVEFKVDSAADYELGGALTVELFEVGQKVHVTGTSKGKGFQGMIRRHNKKRGPETHGCMTHRKPGSIGTSATPSRVLRGKRLPGHMGAARVTVKNLTVIDVRPEQNLILLKGAVPGHINGLVTVRKSEYR